MTFDEDEDDADRSNTKDTSHVSVITVGHDSELVNSRHSKDKIDHSSANSECTMCIIFRGWDADGLLF